MILVVFLTYLNLFINCTVLNTMVMAHLKFCKYHSMLRNIPEECRPHLHHGRSLTSFMVGS
jgi:hypothetical protein